MASRRRNLVGSVGDNWCEWDDQELDDMDGTLSSQQYLQQVIRKDNCDVEAICTTPEGHDPGVWMYDHLRIFVVELGLLVVVLRDVCECQKMQADEWTFLCAAHKNAKECSAMEYLLHNLDGTSALLNSMKLFPSRISVKEESKVYFTSITRRLYRIFAHGYFHHREVFDEFENETHLCARFTKFVLMYELMSADLLFIPEEAYALSNE